MLLRMNDTLPRLRLTGRRAPSEHIDGAWWPTSKRLADELPALMAAVSDVMPHIAMVGYRRDGWIAPPSLTLDGAHPVELLEFVSSEPPTVILIGEDGHHLTLRIIDPDTDEGQAQRSLAEIPRRTADIAPAGGVHARSVHEVAKKLAEHEGRNDPARDARSCNGAKMPPSSSTRPASRRSCPFWSSTSSTIGSTTNTTQRRYRWINRPPRSDPVP